MEIFLTANAWILLATLTFLEIVLGIDNIVFISIITGKLPKENQPKTRTFGLVIALVMRIVMLFFITHIMGFKASLFTLFNHSFSIRDIILLAGGIFLIYKSTIEMYAKVEGKHAEEKELKSKKGSFWNVIMQIVIIDFVFSFDSILTAIGMAKEDELIIMVLAVVISMIVMILFSGRIAGFINNHPTIQVLALSFLLLIGVMLVAESFGDHVNKGYLYSAIIFSMTVELLNMRMKKRALKNTQ